MDKGCFNCGSTDSVHYTKELDEYYCDDCLEANPEWLDANKEYKVILEGEEIDIIVKNLPKSVPKLSKKLKEAKNRINELETKAWMNMTGEDIESALPDEEAEEFSQLAYGDGE